MQGNQVKPYYEDDFVTLYHGDCLEVTEWLEADVLVTDPPYGIAYREKRSSGATREERQQRAQIRLAAGTAYIANDRTAEARDAALALWGEKPGLVFGTWRIARPQHTVQRLIWHKSDPGTGLSSPETHPWVSKEEEIYVIGKRMGDFGNGRVDGNVYITSEIRSAYVTKVGHPTPKPIALMGRLLDKCRPEWAIADPFAGSGSTLVAAKQLGRRAIGVELEERYCEIAAQRLSQDVLDLEGLTA